MGRIWLLAGLVLCFICGVVWIVFLVLPGLFWGWVGGPPGAEEYGEGPRAGGESFVCFVQLFWVLLVFLFRLGLMTVLLCVPRLCRVYLLLLLVLFSCWAGFVFAPSGLARGGLSGNIKGEVTTASLKSGVSTLLSRVAFGVPPALAECGSAMSGYLCSNIVRRCRWAPSGSM